jgi:small ligand-binding sensory domain FIST
MAHAGVGSSRQADPREAADEAVEGALAGAATAEAAMVFAGSGYGDGIPLLLDAVASALGSEALVGATAHGVLAGGLEIEDPSSVAVLAWSGVSALPFLLADPRGEELSACEEIAERVGGMRAEDLVVLLPDPRSFAAGEFLAAAREVLAPARLVGAGAGDPVADAPLHWCGRVVASGGLAGMVLRGARPPRIGVTQACRPATELLTVTRSRGHWILELDGRPALDVYREVARGPLAADLRRAAAFLLVGLPVDAGAPQLAPGSYLVRQVIGFEHKANAFAIPDLPKPGDRLALVARDPQAARDDLKAMLAGVGGPPGAFGLYFDCCARGAGFFGVQGLEAAYLESSLGPAPLAGMFGSCEIGPVGDRTELLTYTGVLALVDA